MVTDNGGEIIHIDQTESDKGAFSFDFKTPAKLGYTIKVGGWFLEYPFEKNVGSGNTVYVSSAGSDTSSGEKDSPVKTMRRALELACSGDIIRIMDVAEMPQSFGNEDKTIIISGGTLDFNSINSFNANGNLIFKDVVLDVKAYIDFYANGYSMTFDTGVSILNDAIRISLYGGAMEGDVGASNITVKSGLFKNIYGGSKYGDVTFDTNISIEGGYIRGNIYGGNNRGSLNGNTNVSITGGSMYSVFGGNQYGSLTGNTNISIEGGTVRHSVFGGCGNYYTVDTGYSSSYYVDGMTNITVSGNPVLCSEQAADIYESGIYGGSCYPDAVNNDEEINTVIFADNCYELYKDTLTIDNQYAVIKQNLDYIINSGTNGKVYATDTAGVFSISPEIGYLSKLNENSYSAGGNITFPQGVSTVVFAADYMLNGVSISRTDTSALASINLTANGLNSGKSSAKLIASLYSDDALVGTDVRNVSLPSTLQYDFEIKHEFEENKVYTIKIMLLDSFDTLIPLIKSIDKTL